MNEGDGGGPAGVASATFSNIVAIVTIVMFVCLILWVVLALLITTPTSSQSALIEGVSHGFAACLGALLGLLGGKLS